MAVLEAKPTLYRDVRFRSRSEARFAATLFAHASVTGWIYEPTQWRVHKWRPDFEVRHLAHNNLSGVCERARMLVEYKPTDVSSDYVLELEERFNLLREGNDIPCWLICVDFFKRVKWTYVMKQGSLVQVHAWQNLPIDVGATYRFDLKQGLQD